MSFVVVRAARPDRAVAHRGLVRSALPQLERHGGLHVVVLHADERALPAARLSDDECGLTCDAEFARLAFRRTQPPRAPPRRVFERVVCACLAGDAAELAQLVDEAIA